jgi:hypothetical protein
MNPDMGLEALVSQKMPDPGSQDSDRLTTSNEEFNSKDD